MENGKLGVAIHGAGNVAHAHAASWMKNPNVEIVSVSSRRRETAQRLIDDLGLDCPAGDDFDAVLADPRADVVNLSGPNHVHAAQGIAAAEAGKHILIEKPMAITMEENRALRDAVEKAGVRSIVSFVLRWNPLFENIKSLLASGAIGELFYAEVDYWHGIGPWYHGQAWAVPSKTGGSSMLLAGCHGVDALRWFVGDEVVEVAAVSNNKLGFFEYDANVAAVVKFRSGIIGKTSVLLDCQMPYSFNIDLVGTEGTLRDDRLWSKKLLPGQTDWATLPTVLPNSGDVHHHPFDAEINDLVDSILQGRESHCNVADAYKTHELCMAIDRSIAEGGRPVKLPL
ncbi:MAG: Gfo/Idh/MocA family oxidoreductase [Planctomycetes bacterium]|nr:Gfo/Idh/MocA family oxidoreductase [Planctomycetota bacterium]MBU4398555.1 Gfo/Idh/MocA family oxidoreductase [Planctomycetota bacterium]MCG2685459.1 Gfo/Idh/MocA family oxidoreductase [Planctomycetales bacterium]